MPAQHITAKRQNNPKELTSTSNQSNQSSYSSSFSSVRSEKLQPCSLPTCHAEKVQSGLKSAVSSPYIITTGDIR